MIDQKFLERGMMRACWFAQSSLDPDTQTGCAIYDVDENLITGGSNRVLYLIENTVERNTVEPVTRLEKYYWIEHSERNAIYGLQDRYIEGGTIFLNWFPCVDCARAIVAVGLKRLVFVIKPETGGPSLWGFATSKVILEAGGVELFDYDQVSQFRKEKSANEVSN